SVDVEVGDVLVGDEGDVLTGPEMRSRPPLRVHADAAFAVVDEGVRHSSSNLPASALEELIDDARQFERLVALHAVAGALDDHDVGVGPAAVELGHVLVRYDP